MKRLGSLIATCTLLLLAARSAAPQPAPIRWTTQAADQWYANEPWLVGSNYLPSYAVNELEMWQAATFDPKRIDKELGWAEGLGMNTMRVFLHDLLWKEDPDGFKQRINTFLNICQRHHIRPMFVLFDSCWNPNPHLGPQPKPTPGVHNSQWVQSPGAEALTDPSQYPRLKDYVRGIVGAFGKDDRVLAWDIWNEPDNTNSARFKEPANKVQLVLGLLPQAFAWARSANPRQPLTSGIWHENPATPNALSPMAKIQLESSDIVTFHNYDPPAQFEAEVKWLQKYNRPIICTEYMARPRGSTFEAILPIAKEFKVGAINWGFVAGKSQTYLPWDSWEHPYVHHKPALWFHDIFRHNGKPYRRAETAFIREMTGKAKPHHRAAKAS